jgi:PIN domain nuclease of toxin-antitoxin system
MLVEPDRFAPATLELLENEETVLYLSAASSWEIAIKYALGKLRLPDPPHEFVPDRMLASGVTGLPIEHRHALAVAALPPKHRDPFDRLLVAQALVEDLPILTADTDLGRYDVEILPV